ncbi:Zinc finger CCCH domain-containing protein 61 [Hibiscus syriacus]|uniref:Zinc finger CCCH domain-containing protein 61 n=1 Tax=Hibiscus syriacus TaxID=106335 RepID=A0A6A2YNV1_HIBSY|nr:Zinc finger CCCH domain-containing protein 61 [Hibiscus syriacus]
MSTACAEQQLKFLASHNVQLSPYEAAFEKYLLSNRNIDEEDEENDGDPYGADHFQKARRRDPRHYSYSSTVCYEFRRGDGCPRGDDCDFAHGVFECWLHPTRYRTEACKDGKNCKRKVCFFAHSSRELRLLPAEGSPKYKDGNRCCLFCHSPTSTLLGWSHLSRSPSPPLSPVKQRTSLNGLSPISRYSDRLSKLGTETTSYQQQVLNELMSSLENMNFCEASSSMAAGGNNNPTTTNFPWSSSPFTGEHFGATSKSFNENVVGCDSDPDFGWVNELLK